MNELNKKIVEKIKLTKSLKALPGLKVAKDQEHLLIAVTNHTKIDEYSLVNRQEYYKSLANIAKKEGRLDTTFPLDRLSHKIDYKKNSINGRVEVVLKFNYMGLENSLIRDFCNQFKRTEFVLGYLPKTLQNIEENFLTGFSLGRIYALKVKDFPRGVSYLTCEVIIPLKPNCFREDINLFDEDELLNNFKPLTNKTISVSGIEIEL